MSLARLAGFKLRAKAGDPYKRREVEPSAYQCGCRWRRDPKFGDVLDECAIHHQATAASWRAFMKKQGESTRE